jgi:hypothetical protein
MMLQLVSLVESPLRCRLVYSRGDTMQNRQPLIPGQPIPTLASKRYQSLAIVNQSRSHNPNIIEPFLLSSPPANHLTLVELMRVLRDSAELVDRILTSSM